MANRSSAPADPTRSSSSSDRIISLIAWVIALAFVFVALILGWRRFAGHGSTGRVEQALAGASSSWTTGSSGVLGASQVQASLPDMELSANWNDLTRRADLRTVIPTRPRQDALPYTVSIGNSVFEVAARFNLKPESVLWANYDQLNDNPDLIALGMQLQIPPADGVLYQWQAGDTFEAVAASFGAQTQDILNWPGNNLDLTNPQVEADAWVMVPGGHREFRQWLIPTIPRGSAGCLQCFVWCGSVYRQL